MKKIILTGAVLLCLSCAKMSVPTTLEEEKLPELIEQAKKDIGYEDSEIEATLLTIGSNTQGWGGSASVAYIMLKNDSILIIAPNNIKPPFNKEQARLLIKSKLRGEMLFFD